MDSNEVEIEKSKSELKHLGFVKEIALKLLVVISNVYDFAKENSGVFKTAVVSAETVVVSAVKPVYEKVKDFSEQIIVFVDEKFDKYAPSVAKNLLVIFQSLIDKTTPLVQKLLKTAQSVITPLFTAIVSILQKLLETTKLIIQKILTTIKSSPLVGKAQTLLKTTLNTTKTLAQVSIQKGLELAKQALDTTISIVGNIPFVRNAVQSLKTKLTDLGNQLVKEYPVLGVVYSAIQNIVKQAQSVGTKVALQSAYTSFKLVAIPVIAQMWYKLNTYPLGNALAKFSLPMIEYLAPLYNKVVPYMDGKGYSIFGYLPILPIEEMKAAYKLVKTTMDGLSAVGDLAGGLVGMNDNKDT